MSNNNGTIKVIAGVLAGAAAGVIFGVLYAPDKGSKTRKRLMGSAKDLAEDIKYKMREEATTLRSKADELESMAESKLDSLTARVKNKANSILHPTDEKA